MTPHKPRIVRVAVGPPGGAGRQWSDIFIEAEIEKTNASTPSKAEVKLHNLSIDSLLWLENPGLQIQVLAGEGVPSQLFLGDLDTKSVKTTISGVDQTTVINGQDGLRRIRNTTFSRSYPPGTSSNLILGDIIAAMGLPIGYQPPSLPVIVYQNGWAFAGRIKHALTQVLASVAAFWFVRDGALIIMFGGPVPGNAVLISPATGMIGSPERTDSGVSAKVLLNPAITPGSLFTIQSYYIAGSYRVAKAVHRLDSHGQVWETDVEGVPLP
jgi:hypothetical protein